MKFQISRPSLTEAVSQVSKAVSTKTTVPILTGIKVTVDEEGLWLTGSNSDLTIQVCIPIRQDDKEQVKVERIGSVVLPGRIFSEIVRKLPGDEVDWVVDERWKTTLRSGQAQFELKGLDPEEYPRIPSFHEDRMFSLPADLLKSMIRQTGFAVSTSEARGVLTGVLWQLEGGNLTFVATDSHRLSRRQAEVEGPEDLKVENVVVPGKSMSELGKILADRTGWVDVILADNQILIRADHLLFFSRLLDGAYPDTNRVIPKGGKTEIRVSTKEILQSVDRAALISRDGRDNVIKWTVKEEGLVQVQSTAQDVGSVLEEVSAQVKGEEISLSFNAQYMLDALRAVDSDEIKILLTGTMTPFVIQPADREDALHLIVPIRTR
ncbi:DNA polymerase-3 subunit beta [Melghirimyces profundicolus]|uniref:Beta sliding clamp n=1 Tax=Melghirimyces profundicolus TaxID=1242148 RepID=A0A2T6BAL2_9BACL|nr:DNA polymerase III subunit beta [Melghirimyces profundicolus]PTX53068.1 DNA polymerase-3 subunit beta [Melghirimyces profundicolus]